MMNIPILICENSFQTAWAKALVTLRENKWRAWNLVVQINNPELFDNDTNEMLTCFAKKHNLITPKHVAHTIFPQTFYSEGMTRELFYKKYMRFFAMSRNMPHSGWGTYFERMIKYESPGKKITDQLGSIIDNINSWTTNYGASFVMTIPYPHRDINRPMGAPCLNYITVQVEYADDSCAQKQINLLAVYRNHDFLERAYGNYLGLCNLLKYIAIETRSRVGMLTCVSSRADVKNKKVELFNIANFILEGSL
jgi:thymidylate synthase